MDYILQMKGVSKVFPGVRALDDVHFNIPRGKVMALLGENGAGKSTLMKILSGVYERTQGEILLNGNAVEFKNPREAQEHKIAIIHQELNLLPELSIGENIFIGREPVNMFGKINWKELHSESRKLLEELDFKEDSKMKVGDLSIGKKQMVEIAKALSLDAEIIIMDEPTDALTDNETLTLFSVINKLRESGKSIVYISHRLNEIFQICDYVTVLRDGQFIDECLVSDIDEDKLIELMVGRKLTEQYPRLKVDLGEEVLKVENLTNKFIKDVSFSVRKGEILGVAGLMGAGRTELAKSIYGAIALDSGLIYIDGNQVSIKSSHDAINKGISYVSEDRKKDGLVLSMDVKKNMSLSALEKFSNAIGFIDMKSETKEAEDYVEKISIKTPSLKQKIKNLSGGNQQKVSISKSLMTAPKVLILDEPTRGVDVGAKKEIYDLMNTFKKEGMSIIMISSEIPEILGLSDRIMVVHEGSISGILENDNVTQEDIMRLAVGVRGAN